MTGTHAEIGHEEWEDIAKRAVRGFGQALAERNSAHARLADCHRMIGRFVVQIARVLQCDPESLEPEEALAFLESLEVTK